MSNIYDQFDKHYYLWATSYCDQPVTVDQRGQLIWHGVDHIRDTTQLEIYDKKTFKLVDSYHSDNFSSDQILDIICRFMKKQLDKNDD